MADITIIRNSARISLASFPKIGSGSENITVAVNGSGEYSTYTTELYYGFYVSGVMQQMLAKYESGVYTIPANALFKAGNFYLTVRLVSGNNKVSTNTIPVTIEKSAVNNDYSILPAAETWQSAVDYYINNANSLLNTRIDNLIISKGSDSSAEVIDARTGYDNIIYSTLGSAIRGQIGTLNNSLGISPKVLSFTDDTYIKADGTKISGSSSFHVLSEAISLKKGNMITVTCKGASNVTSIISKVSDGVYKPLVICDSNDNKTYSYTAYEDMDVVISASDKWNKTVLISISIYNINTIINDLTNAINFNYKKLSFTDDTYIKFDGTKISGSSSFHVLSEAISLKKGNMITVTCKGVKDYTSIISKVSDEVYKPLVICDSNDNKTYSYTAYEDMDVVISASDEWNKTVLITTFNFLTNISADKSYVDFSLFTNFGVIGDSYASGEMYFNGNYVDNYKISWGQILARKCGNTCINYSKGGLTTRSWLTNANYGLTKLLQNDANDLYILALGINDYYHLGETYLGTINDIKDDYLQNSDTFYGNYGKIISQIMNHAPNAKIIISDIANPKNVKIINTFNTAIYNIASKFNIACIKQSQYWFFNSSFYLNNMVQGHPIAKVYSGMALSFKELIEQSIEENASYFNDLFMY